MSTDMLVVAFTGLVVVTHHTFTTNDESQPVLERMLTAGRRMRHKPARPPARASVTSGQVR